MLTKEDIVQIALGLRKQSYDCKGVALYQSYTGKGRAMDYEGIVSVDGNRRCISCYLEYVDRRRDQ